MIYFPNWSDMIQLKKQKKLYTCVILYVANHLAMCICTIWYDWICN